CPWHRPRRAAAAMPARPGPTRRIGSIGPMPRIRCWPLLSAVLIAAAVALGVISTRTTLLTAADQRMSERLYTSDEGLVGALATVFDLVFSPVAGVVIAAALIGGLL